MMLWSESWNISTRLRPRSFAALQAISAVARACASGLSERPIGRDAQAHRYFECTLARARHDALGGGTDLLGDRRGRFHA